MKGLHSWPHFRLGADVVAGFYKDESVQKANCFCEIVAEHMPCVVFMDEADAFLQDRAKCDQDGRRWVVWPSAQCFCVGAEWDSVVTKFLEKLQTWQSQTVPENRVVVLATTNFPGQLDEAVTRRFSKLAVIAKPRQHERLNMLVSFFSRTLSNFTELQLLLLSLDLDGYVGADIQKLGAPELVPDAGRVVGWPAVRHAQRAASGPADAKEQCKLQSAQEMLDEQVEHKEAQAAPKPVTGRMLQQALDATGKTLSPSIDRGIQQFCAKSGISSV